MPPKSRVKVEKSEPQNEPAPSEERRSIAPKSEPDAIAPSLASTAPSSRAPAAPQPKAPKPRRAQRQNAGDDLLTGPTIKQRPTREKKITKEEPSAPMHVSFSGLGRETGRGGRNAMDDTDHINVKSIYEFSHTDAAELSNFSNPSVYGTTRPTAVEPYAPVSLPFHQAMPEWYDGWMNESPTGLPAYRDPSLVPEQNDGNNIIKPENHGLLPEEIAADHAASVNNAATSSSDNTPYSVIDLHSPAGWFLPASFIQDNINSTLGIPGVVPCPTLDDDSKLVLMQLPPHLCLTDYQALATAYQNDAHNAALASQANIAASLMPGNTSITPNATTTATPLHPSAVNSQSTFYNFNSTSIKAETAEAFSLIPHIHPANAHGQIGSFIVDRHGNSYMIIGNHRYDITRATDVQHRQELVLMQPNPQYYNKKVTKDEISSLSSSSNRMGDQLDLTHIGLDLSSPTTTTTTSGFSTISPTAATTSTTTTTTTSSTNDDVKPYIMTNLGPIHRMSIAHLNINHLIASRKKQFDSLATNTPPASSSALSSAHNSDTDM